MFGSNRFVQWAGAVGHNSPCRTGIKISHTHTHTQILSLFLVLIDGQTWPLRRQAIQLTSFCYLVLTKIGEA